MFSSLTLQDAMIRKSSTLESFEESMSPLAATFRDRLTVAQQNKAARRVTIVKCIDYIPSDTSSYSMLHHIDTSHFSNIPPSDSIEKGFGA